MLFSGPSLMWLVLTAASFLAFGVAIVRRYRGVHPTSLLSAPEHAFAVLCVALVTWLGTTWMLALAQLLNGPVLILRTLTVGSVGGVLLWRSPRIDGARRAPAPEWLLLATLVGAWVGFTLWRGSILPPLSHDALAYHLPKAVLFDRLGGFSRLDMLMANIRSLPANYEMLLADVIACTGSDQLTEWISVVMYVILVSGAAALASRWWPASRYAPVVGGLYAAGIPVALLHSGTHKNDLMVAAFMVASCVWFGRWVSLRENAALTLFLLTSAAAIGTKPQAAALVVSFLPVLMWTLISTREGMVRRLLMIVAVAIVCTAFLGGAVYVSNMLSQGAAFSVGTREQPQMMAYGDWRNLWQGPWVLVTAPFSPQETSLWVPWEETRWFWRRYEVYFSHMGIPFAICAALLLPLFAYLLFRRELTREGVVVSAGVAVTFLLALPVVFEPHGMYAISLPRYVLFVVPVVFTLTVCAAVALAERQGQRWLPIVVVALGAVSLVGYGLDTARHDTFAPWSFLMWARENPGTRVIPFDPNRAASVVDRAAGPDDRVALDAGVGTWIHPAFGAKLARPVDLIPAGEGTLQLPEDVRWVAIDRAAAVVWGHPDFRDLSQVRQFLMKGTLSPADTRVYNQLRTDPRFELVFYNPRLMQAVFRRVEAPVSGR